MKQIISKESKGYFGGADEVCCSLEFPFDFFP